MIFTAELKKARAADSPASTTVELPIGPYRMLDILDKLRLHEQETIIWEITDYHLFEELEPLLDKTGAFFELNALAWRLMELDEVQSTAFAGLLAMEDAKGPIPLPRLIDLAYSTQSCHVLGDAPSGSQPDRTRASEKGVFVKQSRDHPGGYVSRHGDLTEAYKNLDLTPRKPEYVIRASIKYDPVAGPDVDLSQVICIDLPASEEQVRYMDVQMTGDWLGTYLYSIDSVIPQITDHILCVDSIPDLNPLAHKVAALDPAVIPAYKALLEAAGCRDYAGAERLIDTLDQYSFYPHFVSPADVAKEELLIITAEDNAQTLLPYLNLHEYGEALIQKSGGVLTSYGLIERKDGHPIQSPRQEQPEGGMSFG